MMAPKADARRLRPPAVTAVSPGAVGLYGYLAPRLLEVTVGFKFLFRAQNRKRCGAAWVPSCCRGVENLHGTRRKSSPGRVSAPQRSCPQPQNPRPHSRREPWARRPGLGLIRFRRDGDSCVVLADQGTGAFAFRVGVQFARLYGSQAGQVKEETAVGVSVVRACVRGVVLCTRGTLQEQERAQAESRRQTLRWSAGVGRVSAAVSFWVGGWLGACAPVGSATSVRAAFGCGEPALKTADCVSRVGAALENRVAFNPFLAARYRHPICQAEQSQALVAVSVFAWVFRVH